jgi:hypothetical protein
MFRGGVADAIGGTVTYLASLGATGGVAGRFLVAWGTRRLRRPKHLATLRPAERIAQEDEQSWSMWIGTVAGAGIGMAVGIGAIVFDFIGG